MTHQKLYDFIQVLKEDPEMRRAYKDNIAMAFVDATAQNPESSISQVANIAAENFINLLTKDHEG